MPEQPSGVPAEAMDAEGPPSGPQAAGENSRECQGVENTRDVQADRQRDQSAAPLKKFEVLYTQERSEKDKEVRQTCPYPLSA